MDSAPTAGLGAVPSLLGEEALTGGEIYGLSVMASWRDFRE